jgi:hypothetical protein
VGSRGTTALTNGNYVVTSHAWNNGTVALAGAVTWGNGSTGIIGPVNTSNSLYSSIANVLVGFPGVTALTNGNYVVSSMNWNEYAGAVTWGNGRTGTVGAVNATNSLVGALVWDQVGTGGVTALTNGNYVVSSQEWRTGNMRPGAVTWCDGDTGLVGTVNTSNSLYGSSAGDAGGSTVTALTNGNYVVTNPSWNNGSTANVGAVTWCVGSTGNVGAISATNSLLGTNAEDQVGSSGVIALTNGNYVVCSSKWKNGSLAEAGAVTWADGSLATSSVVSTANSLVGSSAGDQIGSGAAIAMTNGNYAVLSSKWKNGSLINAGAVTWADGNITTSASVSSLNSLIGSHAEDQVGSGGVVALANGHYVVRSLLWDNGLIRDAAALTWSSGITGISGAISATNSQIGDLDFTASAVPTQDLLNNHFMTSRVNDEGSKIGLGCQENGFAFAPEIALRGGGRAIVNGNTTPRTENDTDFNSVVVLNNEIKHVFTIRNTGNTALNLSGTPRVTIAGRHAADFTVTKQPSPAIPLNDFTTFEITFDPSLPGQREANVSIRSDDSGSSPFVFSISGFGALPVPQTQTITFTPPPTLYLGQSPFALTASSSSGLPVTLTVLSGPASISGGDVILNGAGSVTISASQPGGNNFAAAPTVTKTISIKPDPTSLTLLDLAQTYDGNPKEISTIGAVNPTITYSIGGVFGSAAPTNAGSYPVKAVAGSITKTGTLVIAKALLTVTPEYKQKFAGQPNPQLSAVITGYQSTDTASVHTKPVLLTTTARSSSPGGLYPITARGAAALNYNFRYLAGTMVIESFAGSYEVLLVDGTPLPVAKLNIIVTSSGTAFTAKLATATEPLAVSFSGPLSTDPLTEIATGTATTNVTVNKVLVPYTILFNFEFFGAVTASATRQSVALGPITAGRKLWVPAKGQLAVYAGAHTAVFEPAIPAAAAIPVGAGWATATINTLGAMTLAGRLGDGTTFTTTLMPDGEENPGYRFFAQPYIAARTQSYIAGEFSLIQHPNPESNSSLNNRRYVEQTVLTWKKTSLTTDAAHRTSFGPVSTVMMLDPWLQPIVAKGAIPAVTLAQRLGLETTGTNFAVTHSETGSASQSSLPTSLGLSATNVVSVLAPATPPVNRTKWKMLTFKTTDGTFTGSFELSDIVGATTVLRPATFSGVLRQPATSADTLIGSGHYLAPLPSSPERTSGEVMLTRP